MDLCSMLCASLDGRGVWGRMDIWTCMTESLCSSFETIIKLLISYTPIQNKKFEKKRIKKVESLIYPYTLHLDASITNILHICFISIYSLPFVEPIESKLQASWHFNREYLNLYLLRIKISPIEQYHCPT